MDSIFFFIVLRNYYRTKISRTPRRTLVKYIFQRRVRLKPHPQRIPLGGREQRRRLLHLAQPQRNRAPRRNLRDRRRRNNNIPNRNLQNRFQNYLQRHQPNIPPPNQNLNPRVILNQMNRRRSRSRSSSPGIPRYQSSTASQGSFSSVSSNRSMIPVPPRYPPRQRNPPQRYTP